MFSMGFIFSWTSTDLFISRTITSLVLGNISCEALFSGNKQEALMAKQLTYNGSSIVEAILSSSDRYLKYKKSGLAYIKDLNLTRVNGVTLQNLTMFWRLLSGVTPFALGKFSDDNPEYNVRFVFNLKGIVKVKFRVTPQNLFCMVV